MFRMKWLVMFILLLLSAEGVSTPALGTLTMCVDHYPPLQILRDNGEAIGENIAVTRRLVSQLNFELDFTQNIPFGRCLQWLKEGKVDIMGGILDTDDRRQFAHLFLYKDVTIKQFFVRKNGPKINNFSDLKGLRIGVIRGVKHFKQFDNARGDHFNKVELLSLQAAFGMLNKGRLDAVLCTDRHGHRVIQQNSNFTNNIVASNYSENHDTQVYIALSKRSAFARYVNDFNKAAEKLYANKTFAKTIDDFKKQYPQYYQQTVTTDKTEDSHKL